MTGQPSLDRFQAPGEAFRDLMKDDDLPLVKECDCGAPLIRTVYKLNGNDMCLSCALEEAGIEVRRVSTF